MKVVIFGTGMIYQQNRAWIPASDVLAFIDNDINKQGSYLNGIQITTPDNILTLPYDKIVLMSARLQEMKNQLLSMGIPEDSIWTWKRYKYECLRGVLKLFCYHDEQNTYKERILIISQHLEYGGATMAAIHALKALQLRKYQVVLAAPSGDKALIEEMSGPEGINIIICPLLCYLDKDDMYWIKQFDAVIVNVFPMLPCACEISKIKPVLWWLHEVKAAYGWVQEEFPQYDNISEMENINIAAVSEIAKENFEEYYPDRVNHVLPYGIPDEYIPTASKKENDKFTFAIIGGIDERKATKIFVEAIMNFTKEELKGLEFLIIGFYSEDAYYREVKALADKIPQIKFTGTLTREEMKKVYQEIDVVVCSSIEETMSIVVTEGMMHEKVCITTETTGIAEYIVNGNNGFICKTGDFKSLWNTMKWITEHRNELQSIRSNARETYLKYFSLESFGERLERLIVDTERKFDGLASSD